VVRVFLRADRPSPRRAVAQQHFGLAVAEVGNCRTKQATRCGSVKL
jgi:hypothetical protein